MEKSVSLPGVVFDPSEPQIFWILRKKVNGEPLPPWLFQEIPVLQIYGPDKDPWNLFDSSSDKLFHFFFTRLSRKSPSRNGRVAGSGTWSCRGNTSIDGGVCRYYVFKTHDRSTPSNNNGNWQMYEYSLADESGNSYVLCRVRNKNSGDPESVSTSTEEKQDNGGRRKSRKRRLEMDEENEEVMAKKKKKEKQRGNREEKIVEDHYVIEEYDQAFSSLSNMFTEEEWRALWADELPQF